MARRRTSPDPELAVLARERLRRLLDDSPVSGARRAVGPSRLDPPRPGPSRPGSSGFGGPRLEADEPTAETEVRSLVELDDLEPPRRFTRWHLGVVVVVLVVGLVWGGWSLLRARPQALASVAAPASVETTSAGAGSPGPAGSTSPAATPSASPSVAGLVVHVLGAVHKPGLVRLDTGARVQDAIDAAGGLRSDADPGDLNVAQLLGDGEQVVVGTRAHPSGEVRSGGGSGSGSAGTSSGGAAGSSGGAQTTAVVDLNRSSADQLEALPGVGPVTAQKIVAWRTQHGRFSSPEELQEVDGIGPKTYAQIAPHVRV